MGTISSQHTLFGVPWSVWKETSLFYLRLIVWVGFLYWWIIGMKSIPQADGDTIVSKTDMYSPPLVFAVASLADVICLALLLGFLIILKVCSPKNYENFKWYGKQTYEITHGHGHLGGFLARFCTPGNVFLKSWVSLFFYVFVIKVPVALIPVSPAYIVSWVFQCFFGDCLIVCRDNVV